MFICWFLSWIKIVQFFMWVMVWLLIQKSFFFMFLHHNPVKIETLKMGVFSHFFRPLFLEFLILETCNSKIQFLNSFFVDIFCSRIFSILIHTVCHTSHFHINVGTRYIWNGLFGNTVTSSCVGLERIG